MYSEELKNQQTIHYKLTHLQTRYSINPGDNNSSPRYLQLLFASLLSSIK